MSPFIYQAQAIIAGAQPRSFNAQVPSLQPKRELLLLSFLYTLRATLLFIILMIPVAIFAFFAAPAGALRGGNAILRACRLWADIWLLLNGIRHHTLYEGLLPEDSACIFVANHLSYLDAVLAVKSIRRPFRPLGKAELGRVPIFGFIYRRAVVTVDRSSPESRSGSVALLKRILRRGVSILVFPEGMFNESGAPLGPFYDGAFRIAIDTGAPIVPILFPDVYDRMPYDRRLRLTPGTSRAIVLPPVATDGLTPDDLPALRDAIHALMSERLRRAGASWIKE